MVQVYSQYTKKRSKYFNTFLQYGGESMLGHFFFHFRTIIE